MQPPTVQRGTLLCVRSYFAYSPHTCISHNYYKISFVSFIARQSAHFQIKAANESGWIPWTSPILVHSPGEGFLHEKNLVRETKTMEVLFFIDFLRLRSCWREKNALWREVHIDEWALLHKKKEYFTKKPLFARGVRAYCIMHWRCPVQVRSTLCRILCFKQCLAIAIMNYCMLVWRSQAHPIALSTNVLRIGHLQLTEYPWVSHQSPAVYTQWTVYTPVQHHSCVTANTVAKYSRHHMPTFLLVVIK